LSIEETQELRAKLGLPPLRGVGVSMKPAGRPSSADMNSAAAAPPTAESNKEEISLSVSETNALRAKIGLPPLKVDGDESKAGTSRSNAIHARPANTQAEAEARKRVEDAAARREAAAKVQALANEVKSDENELSAGDFAAKMRAGDKSAESAKVKAKRKKKKKTLKSNPQLSLNDEDDEGQYTSADLAGLKVSHNAAEFAAGSTTVLTLADQRIINVDGDTHKATDVNAAEIELVNVNMDHDSQARENLKRKRQIELGSGRAGGYSGFDDEEFGELGGVGLNEDGPIGHRVGDAVSSSKGKGFSIGSDGNVKARKIESKKSDLFSSLSGKAISLASHASNVASDFMTEEHEESKEERLEKERKKQAKLLEKMRKKDKKSKKKKRKNRKRDEESDDDDDEGGSSLLANLEATAVGSGAKKRSRSGGDETNAAAEDDVEAKRARFETIMAKGAERTQRAFSRPIKATVPAVKQETDDESDGGEDDAFLNAALAKARRLKRLKEMSGVTASRVKGEDAVVQAVTQQKEQEALHAEKSGNGPTNNDGGLKYEYDEMQEFTRALRAREDQAKRTKDERKARGVTITLAKKKSDQPEHAESETNGDGPAGVKREPSEVEDATMEELAAEIKDDDPAQSAEMGLSSTANSAGVGRGLSGFLSLLKKTGEISTTAPKEEMRGRAKDERTYEDYAAIDLDKVVQTEGRHEKDVELANREIKLEYRDDFGRLLTRKEAYRNMCYQFHGHGSRMKNQERRLKQIDRERAEAKVASRSEEGVFGALKATQRATGKAFIIHKT